MVDQYPAMSRRRSSNDHRPSTIDHFGFLNINKPAGFSSRDVVNRVQRLVRPAKVGHAGTLDPLATGVLLVCVGPATRLVPVIHELHKLYVTTFVLGCSSQTDDVEGEVIETPNAPRPTREQVLAALPEFVGRIKQRPPAYSAVRIDGRRAYKLARAGHDVEPPLRPVDVHRLDLLRFEPPELVLEIECGSGMYIRSIGRDLGERLGCGAVMSALERTAIGPFHLRDAFDPRALLDEPLSSLLLPATTALPDVPQIIVDETGLELLMDGRSVSLRKMRERADGAARGVAGAGPSSTAIVDQYGTLIALARIEGDCVIPYQVFKRGR